MKTVDGCCPDRGDSTFFTDEEKKDFKIESKDRNSPSGKSQLYTFIRFNCMCHESEIEALQVAVPTRSWHKLQTAEGLV